MSDYLGRYGDILSGNCTVRRRCMAGFTDQSSKVCLYLQYLWKCPFANLFGEFVALFMVQLAINVLLLIPEVNYAIFFLLSYPLLVRTYRLLSLTAPSKKQERVGLYCSKFMLAHIEKLLKRFTKWGLSVLIYHHYFYFVLTTDHDDKCNNECNVNKYICPAQLCQL